MDKIQLIHNFIGYAFYGEVTNKSVDLVNKLFMVYCSLFGCDNIDRKDLQELICQEFNCMISNNSYKSRA